MLVPVLCGVFAECGVEWAEIEVSHNGEMALWMIGGLAGRHVLAGVLGVGWKMVRTYCGNIIMLFGTLERWWILDLRNECV